MRAITVSTPTRWGRTGKAITHDATDNASCRGLQFDGANSECVSVATGGTSGASTFQVTASGSFTGTVDARLLSGAARGSGLRVFAIEFGEPDFFVTSDGHVDGDGRGGDSGGRADDGDDFGDRGRSARRQDADVHLTVTGPTPDFAIAVTATPNTTVANQNVTWNGTADGGRTDTAGA